MASEFGSSLERLGNGITHFPFTILPVTSAIAGYIIEKKYTSLIQRCPSPSQEEKKQLNLRHYAANIARKFAVVLQAAIAISLLAAAFFTSSTFAAWASLLFGLSSWMSASAIVFAASIGAGVELDTELRSWQIKDLLPAILS